MLALGLDIGTQGVRALAVTLDGCVVAEASRAFRGEVAAAARTGHFEQDPRVWREALFAVLREAMRGVLTQGYAADDIVALSATGTSGTLCLVDAEGEPVAPALMYSDMRGEVATVRAAGQAWEQTMGTQFSASFALCKLAWVQRHCPEWLERARWALSPTDLALGWLSGVWGLSDWTNMLKSGYDVTQQAWPPFIEASLGLPVHKLPRVQAPGAVLGAVSPEVAAATGLAPRTVVASGATDGNASQLASGAVSLGDWNSTLGTTLVLKGVSDRLIRDPLGRVYCHLHPDGAAWLPGGASNTGGEALTQRFGDARLAALDAPALARSPTDLIVYPLARRGERFPFHAPQAEGFVLGDAPDEVTLCAAHLEGLAYVERLAYETVQALGAAVGDVIHAVGGATQSRAGLQIRADVLERCLRVPAVPSGAMGAAILAARACAFASVAEAARAMVRMQLEIEPRNALTAAYHERYQRFLAACRERGYLP